MEDFRASEISWAYFRTCRDQMECLTENVYYDNVPVQFLDPEWHAESLTIPVEL